MPHLDSKGPDGKGPASGRKLGKCQHKDKQNWPLGVGMGKKRRSAVSDEGKGKRLKSGKIFENNK
jgi:hypothetical protein